MNFIKMSENKIKARVGASLEAPLVCLKETNNGNNFLGINKIASYPKDNNITKESKCIKDLILARIKDREQVTIFREEIACRRHTFISLEDIQNKLLIYNENSFTKKRSFNETESFRIKQDF